MAKAQLKTNFALDARKCLTTTRVDEWCEIRKNPAESETWRPCASYCLAGPVLFEGGKQREKPMTSKQSAIPAPVRLTFRSVEDVLIETDDEDRFLMTMKEAAHACKQAENEKKWQDDFKRFLHKVSQWCEAKAEHVRAGYVGVGDGALNVFICTKSATYNFDIEDELSDLDIELVQAFPWLIAEVVQIPLQVKEDQIFSETAVSVYGDGRAA